MVRKSHIQRKRKKRVTFTQFSSGSTKIHFFSLFVCLRPQRHDARILNINNSAGNTQVGTRRHVHQTQCLTRLDNTAATQGKRGSKLFHFRNEQ